VKQHAALRTSKRAGQGSLFRIYLPTTRKERHQRAVPRREARPRIEREEVSDRRDHESIARWRGSPAAPRGIDSFGGDGEEALRLVEQESSCLRSGCNHAEARWDSGGDTMTERSGPAGIFRAVTARTQRPSTGAGRMSICKSRKPTALSKLGGRLTSRNEPPDERTKLR